MCVYMCIKPSCIFQDAERESPGVITPHHNEIIDMLRTANIINDNTPYLTEPTKEQQEKAYKEKERVSCTEIVVLFLKLFSYLI